MSRWLIVCVLLITGCSLLPANTTEPTTVAVSIPSVAPVPTVPSMPTNTPTSDMVYPDGLQDVLPILSGICFESAWDAAGQVFILRSAEEHIRFYNLADNSALCRRPVVRHPFDFTQGEVLAGLWSRGYGCVAHYEIYDYDRNDDAKTVRIVLDFFTEGDCPYELVRGFWVSIASAQDYAIEIVVRD